MYVFDKYLLEYQAYGSIKLIGPNYQIANWGIIKYLEWYNLIIYLLIQIDKYQGLFCIM